MQNESAASQMELKRPRLIKIVESLVQGLILRGENSDDDSNFIKP